MVEKATKKAMIGAFNFSKRPCPKKSGEENRATCHIGQEVDFGEFDSYDEDSEFITPPKTQRKVKDYELESNIGTLLSLRDSKRFHSDTFQRKKPRTQFPHISEPFENPN